jgi:hypothetical protein
VTPQHASVTQKKLPEKVCQLTGKIKFLVTTTNQVSSGYAGIIGRSGNTGTRPADEVAKYAALQP